MNMPKFHRIFACLILLSFPLFAASFGIVEDVDGYTNVRSQPTKGGKVIAWVVNGSCVELKEMKNGWYAVEFTSGSPALEGYIYRKNVKEQKSCRKGTEYTVPTPCELAVDGLFRLDSLSALAPWLESHQNCADGANASVVSEFVMHKLAHDWETQISSLNDVAENAAFLNKVWASVNTQGDAGDLDVILKKAQSNCPASHKDWCAKILSAAEQAKQKGSQNR